MLIKSQIDGLTTKDVEIIIIPKTNTYKKAFVHFFKIITLLYYNQQNDLKIILSPLFKISFAMLFHLRIYSYDKLELLFFKTDLIF